MQQDSRPARATLHWGGVSIHSTDPLTVAFFTNQAGNELCSDMAVKNLESWVKCLHACTSANDSQRSTSDVLAYLQAMEQRQGLLTAGHARGAVRALQLKVEETRDALLTTSDSQFARLQCSVDSVSSQVQSHIMTLITTVDHAVRASVEKLDVGAISTLVTATVREWLQSDVDSLKNGQTQAAAAVRDLEGRLRDVVLHTLSQPQTSRHEHLMLMLASLPAQVAAVCATSDVEQEARASLSDKVAEMRVRMDEAMAVQSREVLDTKTSVGLVAQRVQHAIDALSQMGADSGDQKAVATLHIQHVPVILKALLVDTFRELEAQSLQVKAAVQHSQEQLLRMERDMADSVGSMKVLQKTSDDLYGRVHQISQQLAKGPSINAKGAQAEAQLHELLCNKLHARDNYEISVVNGVAHACDIKIQRLGYPDVRVEVKAYGEQSGAKVPIKEVTRFRSDLLAMNSHGIFVSLYGEIATKGKIDFEVLPNNKLAVYLSGNAYDVDIISDMVHFIYRVDKIVETSVTRDDTHLRVTAEDMARVQLLLRDFGIKVQHTKTHLKEAISLLNELTFDRIEVVLMTSRALPTALVVEADSAVPVTGGFGCDTLGCPYVSEDRGRMVRHRKKVHNADTRYRGVRSVNEVQVPPLTQPA